MQLKSIARTATSLIVVGVLYSIYLVFAVPWIEPPVAERTDPGAQPVPSEALARPTDRYRPILAPLFPADSWELNDAKILKSDYGMLLVRDYRPLDNGRLQLHPCTIVVIPPGQSKTPGESRPLVLEAPEGAILQFDRSLDLRAGKLGQLISGQLKGPITLRQKASSPGANDGVRLVTRSVQISQQRIWTPHEVEFQIGQAEGKGRDLMIEFSRTDPSLAFNPSKQAPLQLKSLELVHVDYLRFVLPPKTETSQENQSSFAAVASNPATTSLAATGSTDPIELTCRGPLFVDFLARRATLEDTVDIRRLRPNGESDQMSCEQVSIYFDAGQKSPTGSTRYPKLSISHLEAYGAPVNLSLPSMQAAVRARKFNYDAKAGIIEAEGPQGVELQHQGRTLQALAVRYTLAADGVLGPIEATGPGRFFGRLQADSQQPLVASWQQNLTLVPQDNNGYLLSLSGGSQLQLAGKGQLQAQRIDAWLRSASPTTPQNGQKMPDLQLDRMAAGGNVEFQAGRFQGGTDQLEIWYRDLPAAGSPAAASPAAGSPAAGSPAAGSPAQRPQTNPQLVSLASSTTTRSASSISDKRIDVRGDQMRVLISGMGEDLRMHEATVQGHVRLEELDPIINVTGPTPQPPPPPPQRPTYLQGDRLKLTDVTATTGRAVMTGRPALIRVRGISIEGMSVLLDRQSNQIQIPGRGKARLPLTTGLGGRTLANPMQIDVDWQGKMDFDGQVLSFHDNVKLRGPDQVMQMQILSVHLSQPLKMDQVQNAMTVPQVEQLVGQGEVYVEQSTHEGSQLTAVDRMRLASVRIQPSTGDITGEGPGWVTSVRKGLAPGRLPSRSGSPLAGGSSSAGFDPDELSSLRIDFQRGIEGNMKRRELHFVGQVRATLGAVTDWSQTVDPKQVGTIGNTFGLVCDRLSVEQMQSATSRRPSAELTALGNTTIEGNGFTARAHRLSYSQEKDLLVLEGDGRTDALLWRQARIGAPRDQAAAGKIYYWPSTNRLKVDDIRMLEFGSLSGAP